MAVDHNITLADYAGGIIVSNMLFDKLRRIAEEMTSC